MKRLLVRFSMLFILMVASAFVYFDNPVAASTDCGMATYAKWTACDNAFSNTVYTFTTRNTFCDNNSANVCSTSANSFCSQQASTTCQGNPDPQCYNNSYNPCYWNQFQSCQTQTTVICQENVENAYTNRFSSYGSCLGAGFNYSTCIEQLDGECSIARDRAQSCSTIYSGEDEWEAKSACIFDSGVHRCE